MYPPLAKQWRKGAVRKRKGQWITGIEYLDKPLRPYLADRLFDELGESISTSNPFLHDALKCKSFAESWAIEAIQWDEDPSGGMIVRNFVGEQDGCIRDPDVRFLTVHVTFCERSIASGLFATVESQFRPVGFTSAQSMLPCNGFGGLLCEMAERLTGRTLEAPLAPSGETATMWEDWERRKLDLLRNMLDATAKKSGTRAVHAARASVGNMI